MKEEYTIKTKYTNEDLLKRIENLEKVIWELEYKRIYPFGTFKYPEATRTSYHYHNGIICYQNPCVWC